jgi:beta-glucosidase
MGEVVMAQRATDKALDKRIQQQISQMTLEEKITMLHANGLFSSSGVQRLGIPDLVCDDGPLGVREEVNLDWSPANLTTDSATFFPNGSALAATWNTTLANRFGVAMGEETRFRNKDIILSPAFNIARTPLCGRTYEYYSEDPFLNARLAVAAVKGIQSQGVAACIKHYALNNQETDRQKVNVEVGERALQEIYLPAFKAAATEGNAWSVMTAYNKFRGEYCSESNYLINTLLKQEWGLKGLVMSDWHGTHSTIKAAQSGLDLEMGTAPPYDKNFFGDSLLVAVKAGQVSTKLIDDKVYRILWVMHQTSLNNKRPAGSINTAAHSKTVYDVAAEAIVLLKNEKQVLPLQVSTVKSIAVIGDNATLSFSRGGVGAGVKARYEVTALEGLRNSLGSKVDIRYAQGYHPDYKVKYTDEQKLAAEKPNPALINEAVALARQTTLAILFIGGNREYESESTDRPSLVLPFGEQELVNAVVAVNPNTIVVVVGGAPYDIGEIKQKCHTILWSWYNGSEGGNALADIITGKVNPSGKLPFTFPAKLEHSPAHALQAFPGNNLTTEYKEGILVGYRWFDTKHIQPLYSFGYGLSYTSFGYGALVASKKAYKEGEKINLQLTLKNTGKYDGKEIVQLYVSKESSMVERAAKELKAFEKVWVPAGKEVVVKLAVNVKDLAFFNEKTHQWEVEAGAYKFMAASAAEDLKQTITININQ